MNSHIDIKLHFIIIFINIYFMLVVTGISQLCVFCRMFVRSGSLLRLFSRSAVQSCHQCVQRASVIASEKIPIGTSLKNFKHQSIFPVHEAILTQMRCDVLLKDAYRGRVVRKIRAGEKLSKGKWDIPDLRAASAKQQLETLSQQELVDFMEKLASATLSKKRPDIDLNSLQILEDEFCSRATSLDGASLLLAADAFFVMHHHCSPFFSAMFREFEHRWSSLVIRKHDVVQLAMCIIISRKFPLLLVANIEKFLNSNMDKFSAGELSVICLAFFITNTSIENVDVMEKLASAILADLPNSTLKPYQLSNVLKALRHAHFSKPSFYDSLGNLLSQSSALQHESTLTDFSNIAFTYASLRISCPTLFAGISSNAARLIQNRTPMRLKDVGRLVWSFALLQEPLAEAVRKQLVFMLRRDAQLMEQFSEAFTEALLGLAMNEIYLVDLLKQLLSTKFLKQKHGVVNYALMQYFATC